jgi:hypothetical protein
MKRERDKLKNLCLGMPVKSKKQIIPEKIRQFFHKDSKNEGLG